MSNKILAHRQSLFGSGRERTVAGTNGRPSFQVYDLADGLTVAPTSNGSFVVSFRPGGVQFSRSMQVSEMKAFALRLSNKAQRQNIPVNIQVSQNGAGYPVVYVNPARDSLESLMGRAQATMDAQELLTLTEAYADDEAGLVAALKAKLNPAQGDEVVADESATRSELTGDQDIPF